MVWNVAVLAGGGVDDRPLQRDSTDVPAMQSVVRNRIEVRYAEPGGTFEFRHSWAPWISTDLWMSTNTLHGLGLGISIDPVPLLSFQGILGLPVGKDNATDGASFAPNYDYGIRGAFLIPLPLVRSRLYLSLSGGKIWIVDTNYGSGGFPTLRTEDIAVPSVTRRETRTSGFFEIGLGLRF